MAAPFPALPSIRSAARPENGGYLSGGYLTEYRCLADLDSDCNTRRGGYNNGMKKPLSKKPSRKRRPQQFKPLFLCGFVKKRVRIEGVGDFHYGSKHRGY